MDIKRNEIYQELEFFQDGIKIGEAEVNLRTQELSRFTIYEPYQNQGYGTQILQQLVKDYDLKTLVVKADNRRARHVYEKCGFKISEVAYYTMTRH